MANEAVRRGKRGLSGRRKAAAPKKHVKKVAKRAAKKHAKKASEHEGRRKVEARAIYAVDHGLRTAFHHMQRASVVISLMQKGTGEDLRNLLERGVKLYRNAIKNDAENRVVLRAIGVLRAAEHLAMAGLYAARAKHKQKVTSPTPHWLTKLIAETDRRLEKIEQQRGDEEKGIFPVTVELLRQAEDARIDAHLAFELAMAADSLCFALEQGL